MEIIQQIKKEAVYWSWGCGGHYIDESRVPRPAPPNPNHHATEWIPHFVTTKNASLKHNPGPYIGWKQMYLGCHSRIAVFLKPFKDNKIVITEAEQIAMVNSAIQMGYPSFAICLSEIVLHDKDMNPLRHITDLFYPLLMDHTHEIIFDTIQVEMTP